MLPIVHKLLEKFMPRATEKQEVRFACVSQLMEVYKEMYNWSADSPGRLALHGRRFILSYMELSQAFRNGLTIHLHMALSLISRLHHVDMAAF